MDIKDLRLTDREILMMVEMHMNSYSIQLEDARAIADTATKKAVEKVIEWTEGICKEHYYRGNNPFQLRRDCPDCKQNLKKLGDER